jgi:hypothetical protein
VATSTYVRQVSVKYRTVTTTRGLTHAARPEYDRGRSTLCGQRIPGTWTEAPYGRRVDCRRCWAKVRGEKLPR